jgi:CMP-N-acetylneuraminic acid synthetase
MNVAIIPARGNSKSVARKNLRPLAGKPLLQWTIDAAKEANVFDHIVLTSEDDEILKLGLRNNIMTLVRQPWLSQDFVQSSEVALDALRQLQLANIYPDIVTILQPTSPFRTAEDIGGAVDLFNNWDLPIEKRGTIISAYKSAKYHWHDEGWNDKPLYHNPEKRLGRQWESDMGVFVEQGAVYIVSANRFGREGQYRLPPYQIFEMSESHSIDLDSPEEFEQAEHMLERGLVK